MTAKNFTPAGPGRLYDTIATATADPEQETPTAQEAQEVQEPPKRRRGPRKEYSGAEAQELLDLMKTSGRKGVHLPRINLAFHPDAYDYVQTMGQVTGEGMTKFVNKCILQHMEEHRDIYDRAKEFKKAMDL